MNLPDVESLPLEGVLRVVPKRFGDARGFFSETYNREAFRAVGIDCDFVQDNHSRSAERGTVRGLHFQIAPHPQAKLVRVLRGAIFDIAVDLRRASPTFGRSCGTTLTADDGSQIFIPRGFAHGFCTLEAGTEVIYKVDSLYSREHERGLRWNDPGLNIEWPIAAGEAVLNERDRQWPLFADLAAYF
jgi:dTDP-4-dehydrorhamnose 3,5-epimerase